MKIKLSDLKDKAVKFGAKCKTFLTKTLTFLLELTIAIGFVCGLVFLSAKAPELHGHWIRAKVGSKSYLIYEPSRGGGSGFAMKAPSGITYIVTNDHVCGVSVDGQTVMIRDSEGNSMRRRIISRSDRSDLCLIEGKPGVEGLSLGSAPSVGQIIASIGHPAGYDLTLSRGEVIMRQDVAIPEGPMFVVDPRTGKDVQIPPEEGGITPDQCSKPKNRVVNRVEYLFGLFPIQMKWCVTVTEKANFTNMLIQPGSSGSPVVNFWGNVVGVVFAGDRSMWGIFVSQQDLKDFLSQY